MNTYWKRNISSDELKSDEEIKLDLEEISGHIVIWTKENLETLLRNYGEKQNIKVIVDYDVRKIKFKRL